MNTEPPKTPKTLKNPLSALAMAKGEPEGLGPEPEPTTSECAIVKKFDAVMSSGRFSSSLPIPPKKRAYESESSSERHARNGSTVVSRLRYREETAHGLSIPDPEGLWGRACCLGVLEGTSARAKGGSALACHPVEVRWRSFMQRLFALNAE